MYPGLHRIEIQNPICVAKRVSQPKTDGLEIYGWEHRETADLNTVTLPRFSLPSTL
jgi:hypothetical protein